MWPHDRKQSLLAGANPVSPLDGALHQEAGGGPGMRSGPRARLTRVPSGPDRSSTRRWRLAPLLQLRTQLSTR